MDFKYKVLNEQKFTIGNRAIVPIRMEDRFDIRNWRNEQMFHLRQSKTLSEKDQDIYFETVVKALFNQDQPNQILFSFLENEKCIGYGGLVHMNWTDKNAEVSFLTDTKIKGQQYEELMIDFMFLLDHVAFKAIGFHKLFTYTFDVRPEIYKCLESSGFIKEATLKEHCFYQNDFIDVIIHSKFKPLNRSSLAKNF